MLGSATHAVVRGLDYRCRYSNRSLSVRGQLENMYAEFYFALIRACFYIEVKSVLCFNRSFTYGTFLGFHAYVTFYIC